MLVYVLSNVNQTLGVFSSLVEAQKYHSMVMGNGNVKLEEFSLNSTNGRDMSMFLKQKSYISFKPKLIYGIDIIDECDNCGGEDCRRNGECCNDNYCD